jgi:hypothetical protein
MYINLSGLPVKENRHGFTHDGFQKLTNKTCNPYTIGLLFNLSGRECERNRVD